MIPMNWYVKELEQHRVATLPLDDSTQTVVRVRPARKRHFVAFPQAGQAEVLYLGKDEVPDARLKSHLVGPFRTKAVATFAARLPFADTVKHFTQLYRKSVATAAEHETVHEDL